MEILFLTTPVCFSKIELRQLSSQEYGMIPPAQWQFRLLKYLIH